MVEVTVLNNRDIDLLEGEQVRLEIPAFPFLPISVYSSENILMGYLGRNTSTCVTGTITSFELTDLLKDNFLVDAVVQKDIYFGTKQKKVILELTLESKELVMA